MDNFQTRFPMPFGVQGRGMNSQNNSNNVQFNPQTGHGSGGCFGPPGNFRQQGPPGCWGGNQARPPRAQNMIWSDPGFFQSGPPRGFPRGPPPSYGPGAFQQPPLQVHGNARGRGGGGDGWRGRGRGFHHHRGGHINQGNNSGGNTNRQGGQEFGTKKNNKQKVDKRDLPENNAFLCEVCDRGFKTEDKYQEHVSEHQQCSVEGCRYIAAPKLVQLHYQTQHRTGVARKIWSLESPEDISKWIQERKRNYPTKDNITRKRQASCDRHARGEVMETKQFGKFRGRGRRRGHFQDRGNQPHNSNQHQESNASDQQCQNKNSPQKPAQKRPHEAVAATETVPSSSKKVKQENEASEKDNRDPLSLLISDKAGSDDSDASSDNNDNVKPKLIVGGGLASLISSYDTDDDNDDGPPKETSATKCKGPPGKPSQSSATHTDASSSKDHGHSPSPHHQTGHASAAPQKGQGHTEGHPRHQQRQPAKGTSSQQKGQGKNKKGAAHKFVRKPTLLERLLANEIRHERNVILQCVHHIVKSNFWESAGESR